jgi:hypothetical protein
VIIGDVGLANPVAAHDHDNLTREIQDRLVTNPASSPIDAGMIGS